MNYIYQITDNEGHSYIGQRYAKSAHVDDDYMGSSSFYKKHPELVKTKRIIRSGDDKETQNLWESFLICADKMLFHKEKNINFNYGGHFDRGFCIPKESYVKGANKRFGKSEEHSKLAEAQKKGWTAEKRKKFSEKRKSMNIKATAEQKLARSKFLKGLRWYTNGKEEIKTRECPEGWWIGRTLQHSEKVRNKIAAASSRSKGNHWFTNGLINKYCKECPEGWHAGVSEKTRKKIASVSKGNKGPKGNHWFTDGLINKFCKECPEGFHKGFLRKGLKNEQTTKNQ